MPGTRLAEGMGPALLPALAFSWGAESTGKLLPLPSHGSPHLCFVVPAGCSGGRTGAELCDRHSSHALRDGTLREYRWQGRVCVQPLGRQCMGTLPLCTQGYVTSFLPMCSVPVSTSFYTCQGCVPSPYTPPATGVLSIVS